VKKLLLLTALFATLQASAQKFGQKLTGGINVSMGLPSGEFKEANDNVALGLRGYAMYNPARQVPVYLGLELGYGTMGSTTQYFYDPYGGFYDEYEVTASSNIFTILFRTRLQSTKNVALRPFVEGMIGWNDFFSTVNIERRTYYRPDYDDSYGDASEAKWAFTYGGAAGLNIRLSKDGATWLEVKTAYMAGRKTTYLTDPYITSTGQANFKVNESETNMVIPQVGVKFGL
jgi:hypothetical protein